MPRNGSGTYSLPQPAFVAGTVISSSAVNSDLSDIASALTGSLPRDGQAGMTGQFKLADGSTVAPSLTFLNELTTGFNRPGAGLIGVDILGVQVGQFTSSGWSGNVLNGIPVGSIIPFASGTIPSLWYMCFGQLVSRTTFATLFSVIGTTYGAGDGVTTFALPDLRGSTIFGLDNMGGSAANHLTSTYYAASSTTLGTRGGAQSHTMTSGELVSHFHAAAMADPGHAHSYTLATGAYTAAGGGSSVAVDLSTSTTGSATTGVHITSSNGSGNTSSTGSTTAFTLVNPALVMNYIIFAGA
jgi:microcystin-dependent protein